MIEPSRLVEFYEAGRVTRHALLVALLQSAVERSPAEIAVDLPPDILTELRERSAVVPASRDECRVIASVCAGPGFDAEAYFREESGRLYDGLQRWHGYFADA